MNKFLQLRFISLDCLSLLKIISPHPIAAGIFNSLHRIVMCELAPPYLVTKPLILKLKIKRL